MRVSPSRTSTSKKRKRLWPFLIRFPLPCASRSMRYIRGFRDGAAAAGLAKLLIAAVDPKRDYYLMQFCGGHTDAIFRYGVEDLLPENVHLVHGPGCPVCVLAVPRLDAAIELSHQPNVTLVSYGDMLRVPATRRRTLLKARAQGADVRMAYSALEALDIAAAHPDRQVVFFAIGFETTTPATAYLILEAHRLRLANFSVYCNHVVTPAAIQSILDSPEVREWGQVRVDGFIGPSHVSAVIGSEPYEYFAEEYQRLVAEVFELRSSFEWRGLGALPYSGLRIKSSYAAYDAERRFAMEFQAAPENAVCQCPAIIRGVTKPPDCTIFGTACTPRNPIGSCMVSAEGACAAYYKYRRGAVQAAL